MTKSEILEKIEGCFDVERMKIAINQLQEYLDGKRDTVYYWEFEDEQYDS